MNRLTVIIPFLNEGQEIPNTLRSIRETAGNEVDILLVNDASYDGFDYERSALEYNASYLLNETRMGVDGSRDIGVDNIKTEYFLIIDGHMRFYHNDWWNEIVSAIKQNNRALYCCRCLNLDAEGNDITKNPGYGAFINMYDQGNLKTLLLPIWNKRDMNPGQNRMKIPCVLGASYAASKTYWKYLKGMKGLRMYGSSEPYISMKVWLEGGECILLKNVAIGHIFRLNTIEQKSPYTVLRAELFFNKMLVAETLLPAEHRKQVYDILKQEGGNTRYVAMEFFWERYDEIMELKSYYQKIMTRGFESFLQFNEEVKKYNQKNLPEECGNTP